MRRRRMSKGKSRRNFRKGLKKNSRNFRAARGGYRL